jgi:hypothetical protein
MNDQVYLNLLAGCALLWLKVAIWPIIVCGFISWALFEQFRGK